MPTLDLGSKTITAALAAKLQAVFGGANLAETQANIRLYVWTHLRDQYLERRRAAKDGELGAYVTAQRDAALGADAADFPEEDA
jgi:hypothetical protein